MKIHPVGDALVVEPFKSERVTSGGIVIPESEAQKKDNAATKAKVIAIGPLAFEAERRHEKEFQSRQCRFPEVGNTILMGRYAGYDLTIGGEKVKVIWDKDVAAILEEDDE